MNLEQYGWNEQYEKQFKSLSVEQYMPGRIFIENRGLYRLYTEIGELQGEISGKFRYNAKGLDEFPAVGDWVALESIPDENKAIIHAVLPRRSKFSRKVAGVLTQEQVVAANFDYVFIISSLNKDFNIRRMERYLTMAWESGASPVIVLNKKDICPDVAKKLCEVEAIAYGVPVFTVSAVTGDGIEELQNYLKTGCTIVFLGSSGVGKSTLTNRLAGCEIMEVKEIREDDARGRHTTTFRQLVILPGGGIVIDTPGMRELQLWEADTGLQGAFEDIGVMAKNCRFSDCRHVNEPGCAIRAAIQEGLMSEQRLESYSKLQKELVFLESKQNQALRLVEKQKAKTMAKNIRKIQTKF
jgi:ribosome biogenesis GTPase / thiamine phosphate phosphatase